MSAGSEDTLKFRGNERGAVFNGRGSRQGRISGALIQGVITKLDFLGIYHQMITDCIWKENCIHHGIKSLGFEVPK